MLLILRAFSLFEIRNCASSFSQEPLPIKKSVPPTTAGRFSRTTSAKRHYSLLIFHRAVYELVKADHDSVGVGEILHHSALDIELRKQMIINGFVDVMILHHDVLHCGIGYHLAVGLTFIFLFRDFLELAPLALQLPKIIE